MSRCPVSDQSGRIAGRMQALRRVPANVAALPCNGVYVLVWVCTYLPECVEEEFCELPLYGVLRSSAIMQNQGRRQGSFGGRPFAFYASACIFERVSAHGTTESGGL